MSASMNHEQPALQNISSAHIPFSLMIKFMFDTRIMPVDDFGAAYLFLSLSVSYYGWIFQKAKVDSILSIVSARQGHIDLYVPLNLSCTMYYNYIYTLHMQSRFQSPVLFVCFGLTVFH